MGPSEPAGTSDESRDGLGAPIVQNRQDFVRAGIAALALAPLEFRAEGTAQARGRAAGNVQIEVGVQPNGAIGSRAYVGFSWEKQVVGLGTFAPANANLVGLFRRLGSSVLRIGGSTVDTNLWEPDGPGGAIGVTSRADLVRLAAFLAATNWVVAYGLRYRDTDAQSVADEAATAAAILGASLANFEIGNEPDNYTNEPAYERTWESYRRAILARVPDARFMAPETSAAGGFLDAFADRTAGRIEIVSAHHYIGPATGRDVTVDKLLHSSEAGFLSKMERTWRKSKAPAYRVDETNSFYFGGKAGVSNTFAAALWAVRFLLDGARYGSSGFDFHAGTSTQFGHEHYYSPIRFEGTTGTEVIGVQPEFYGLLFVTLVGLGTSYVTTVTGNRLVVAYAIGNNVVVMNFGEACEGTVTLPAAPASARSILLAADGGASATAGQTLGGSSVGIDGKFSPVYATVPVAGRHFPILMPGYSAALIETA
jgi:hypothetical protein